MYLVPCLLDYNYVLLMCCWITRTCTSLYSTHEEYVHVHMVLCVYNMGIVYVHVHVIVLCLCTCNTCIVVGPYVFFL